MSAQHPTWCWGRGWRLGSRSPARRWGGRRAVDAVADEPPDGSGAVHHDPADEPQDREHGPRDEPSPPEPDEVPDLELLRGLANDRDEDSDHGWQDHHEQQRGEQVRGDASRRVDDDEGRETHDELNDVTWVHSDLRGKGVELGNFCLTSVGYRVTDSSRTELELSSLSEPWYQK